MTSYFEVASELDFMADLNLGLGKEVGKERLLLNFFIKLLAQDPDLLELTGVDSELTTCLSGRDSDRD